MLKMTLGAVALALLTAVSGAQAQTRLDFASGAMPKIEPNILLVMNVSVLGFNFGLYIGWSPVDERSRYESQVRSVFGQLFAWHAEGKLRPPVWKIYPLERFTDVRDALLWRRTAGKILLRISPGSAHRLDGGAVYAT